ALIPGQAIRCALGRDYARVVTSNGAECDMAEALAEYEAENEVGESMQQRADRQDAQMWRAVVNTYSKMGTSGIQVPPTNSAVMAPADRPAAVIDNLRSPAAGHPLSPSSAPTFSASDAADGEGPEADCAIRSSAASGHLQ